MPINPFNEANDRTTRSTLNPRNGIADVARFLQGVEITNSVYEQYGAYKINVGDDDNPLCVSTYGQNAIDEETHSFEDKPCIDATSIMNDVNYIESQQMYSTDERSTSMDGIIEPLMIRDVATFNAIEFPIAHNVKAHVMAGNESVLCGVDLFVDQYDCVSDPEPFYDSGGIAMGDIKNGMIPLPGEHWDIPRASKPFNEAFHRHRSILINSSSMDRSMQHALLMMTSSDTDNCMRNGLRSATFGFAFDGNVVDSIAYGYSR